MPRPHEQDQERERRNAAQERAAIDPEPCTLWKLELSYHASINPAANPPKMSRASIRANPVNCQKLRWILPRLRQAKNTPTQEPNTRKVGNLILMGVKRVFMWRKGLFGSSFLSELHRFGSALLKVLSKSKTIRNPAQLRPKIVAPLHVYAGRYTWRGM